VVRFDLPVRQHNLQIELNLRCHRANQIAIIAYASTGATRSRVPDQPASFRVDPAGIEISAGYGKTRRVLRYPPGMGKPGGYGETGGQKPAQYRLGKPAQPFASRPDISNPAGYGRAEIHFCPPLFPMKRDLLQNFLHRPRNRNPRRLNLATAYRLQYHQARS